MRRKEYKSKRNFEPLKVNLHIINGLTKIKSVNTDFFSPLQEWIFDGSSFERAFDILCHLFLYEEGYEKLTLKR